MSKSIDERIVEMQFNNRQFESGVKESLGSLDRLKKGLDLDGASKSLTGLNEAGRKFSLAGIAEGVDTIAGKFTTLGIIGVTALQNIVNSAVNAGKRIVSALTIDPITTGFNEYELKMGSIQTIMAGTGAALDEVNRKLNELNTYSDKTIYSFSDMTQNIGKFTNAGVSLNGAVSAIQGVANVAAVSGANANEASRAMYNFAQALSSGYVKLIDWKSIELANMGTVEFKQQLIDAAVAAGTLTDAGNGMYKTYKGSLLSASLGFNDSLQDQWMTTDVLVKTLGDYADETTEIGKKAFKAATEIKTLTQMYDTLKESAQSGWAQSWEIIAGDFEEGKNLYTQLGNAIGSMLQKSADARNTMLQFWKDNGGRTTLIESFKNAFEALNKVVTPIQEVFRDFFPPMTGERLVALSEGLKLFTERIKIGEETTNNLKRTFAGLFAILSIGKQAISAIISGIGRLIKALSPGASSFLDFTAGIGDWLVTLDATIKKGDIFNKAIEKIANVIEWVSKKVGIGVTTIIDFFKSFGDVDLSGVTSFTDKVKLRFEPFSALFDFIGKTFSKTVEILKKTAPLFFKLATIIGNAISKLQDKIIETLDKGDFNSILDTINTGLLGALILGIRKFVNSMSSVTDGFSGILDGVKGSLEAWQSSLKAGVLLKIAIAVGILAAALLVLSLIDSAKLTSSLTAMTVMFTELFGSMAIFEKIMGSAGFKSIKKITTAMIGLSVAILILSVAVTKLAQLDWQGLAKGLTAVALLAGILVGSAKLLNNSSSGLIKGSLGFILFAAAITILVSAVEKLGALDTGVLAKGLIGVGVLAAELALFMKVTDLSGMSVGKGIGFLALAVAITVLADAVKKFSELDTGTLIKGLAGVAFVLAEVAIFVNVTGDAKRVISTAIGLTILGAAMLIFAQAIGTMGSMSWEQIGKGLLTMAGAMTIITVALNFMPKNMISTGVGLVAIATALVILSGALSNMGGMSWAEIGKGLIILAGSLTIIAVAMAFMKTALPGAVALLVVAAALAILTPVLITLGAMPLAEIGKGLLALAGVFVVIGVAGLVLAPLTPVILALSVAIALLGVGCLAIGAGLLAFSAGLAALAVSGSAGAAALVVIVTSIVNMIPYVSKTLAKGFIEFVKIIGDGAPVIAEAAVKVVLYTIAALLITIPAIVEAVFKLLTAILETLANYIPKIVDAGMRLIIGFLQGIADNIAEVVTTAIEIVINFLNGIASMIPKVIQAGIDLILSFINGLANAIRDNTPRMIDAINNLMWAIVDAALALLTNSITGFMDVGKKIMNSGFIQGIKDKISDFVSTIKDLVTQGIQTLSNKVSSFADVGKNLIDGFISGIKSKISEAASWAANLAKSALDGAKNVLGINSPSKKFEELGMYSDRGFANGLKNFSGIVSSSAKNVGKTAISALQTTISNISDIVEGRIDTSPVIRPVLDLSNVEAGGQLISDLFAQRRGINVESINSKVPNIDQKSSSYDINAQTKDQTNRGNSIAFVQNNYSPKALSRFEIYRQTRNQLSTLKGLVKTV